MIRVSRIADWRCATRKELTAMNEQTEKNAETPMGAASAVERRVRNGISRRTVMPDFERLTDRLRIFAAPDAVTREWARGYQAGKTRARYEVLAVVSVMYFIVALIGKMASA